jgi:hypothetical protein
MLEACVISVYNGFIWQIPLVVGCYVIAFVDFGIGSNNVLLCKLILLVFEYFELAQCANECPLVDLIIFENAWCLAHF